jgi:O-antigen/teichoic acid export membrane protein
MPEAVSVLKKNAWWYLLSMVITGSTAFAAIVITKHWLNAEVFISFNLKLNAVFMLNTICLSWVSLSMYRMYHLRQRFFSTDNLLALALLNAILVGWPFYLIWSYWLQPGGTMVWPLLFLVIAFMYQLMLVSNQASLNARMATMSEVIRGVATIGLMLVPVVMKWQVDELYFWRVWIAAYLISGAALLVNGRRQRLWWRSKHHMNWSEYQESFRAVFRFGWPFTVWMLFTFLLSFADRWYIAREGWPEKQVADYLAIADSVFRGCGFLFVPLNTSGYPLVSRQFDTGDRKGTYQLIVKIVRWELLLLAMAAVIVPASITIIMPMLNITAFNQNQTMYTLFAMVLVHGIWQVGGMLQKPAEMQMKTRWLALANALGAGLVYLLLYLFVRPSSPIAVLACLAAGISSYILLVGWQLVQFGRKANEDVPIIRPAPEKDQV